MSILKKINLINVIKYLFLFLFGGFAYFFIEIISRGFSHYSMIICGGIAFVLCGLINQLSDFRFSIITQMIISTIIITFLELITGYIVNIRLNLNVWDYSRLPYNFHGQICLAYSMIWMLLSIVCIFADDIIRWLIFDEERPKYKLM